MGYMHDTFDLDSWAREAPWMAEAVCRDAEDPDMWFPDKAEHEGPARRACASCPVIEDCLRYALEAHRQGFHLRGIWGGTSARERNALLKRARRGLGRRLR